MLLLVAFEGTEVAAMGGEEEEGHGQSRRALPVSIVSMSFFLLWAWKKPVCFHQVNRKKKKDPVNSGGVGTGVQVSAGLFQENSLGHTLLLLL